MVLSRDITFLNKSYEDWTNVKEPAVIPVTTEEICTIDDYDEMDVPDLTPSDHGTENESNSDNADDIGQGNNP